jgi:hypothetical protein
MKKLSTYTTSLGVTVLLLSAACQLNDLDSAPRAPDSVDTEDSVSPAQVGPVSTGTSPRRTNGGSSPDAGASSLDSGAGTLGDAGNANLPGLGTGDAAAGTGDAATTPGFPMLPSLGAGSLPPGTFGSMSDASIADAAPNG